VEEGEREEPEAAALLEADILYQELVVEAVLRGIGDVKGEVYRGGRLEGSV